MIQLTRQTIFRSYPDIVLVSRNCCLMEKSSVQRLLSALRQGRLLSGARRRAELFIDPWRERWLRRVFNLKCSSEPPFPTICYHGNVDSRALKFCFARAASKPSRLPAKISTIRGMSGQKYRSFINQLLASIADPRYLEIGSWAGSTAAAALYENRAHAVCIDNWSQFGGPRAEFFVNMNKVLTADIKFKFIEKDFRAVNYAQLGKFNVYVFDGPHTEDDQYDGVVLTQAALDTRYFLIVDDWNWMKVRIGTLRALRDLKCTIEYAIELRTTLDNTHPKVASEKSDWHNGYFISVIEKRKEKVDSRQNI